MVNTRQLRMTSIGALTFHCDIDRSVLPEFDAEVNPSDVPYPARVYKDLPD
jgi:hypothetical protein